MLKLLEHSNITELIAAYMYSGRYNFLMPKASSGSLQDLFQNGHSLPWNDDASFFVPLGGLGSSIHSIHQYVCKLLDISGVGCYYDQKPDNVLVDSSKLVLAAFGLALVKYLAVSRFGVNLLVKKSLLNDFAMSECGCFRKRRFAAGVR
jgi:serine/threonine protein kinase